MQLRLALALLLILTGCTQPGPRTPAQSLAFPIPSGWTLTPTPDNASPGTPIQLHDPTGACRIQFSRALSTRPVADAAADMRAAFDKANHPTAARPPMSLGGAPATHFSVVFLGPNPPATRVVENVYLVPSGNSLLTLVTIRSAQCKAGFQPTLDNFHP